MYQSTKVIELGSCAFRQPKAKSHCRHIHGYRLISKLWFGCNELDSNNWVMDFGGLKDLKTLLEQTFDHTLVVDEKDPQLGLFRQLAAADTAKLVIMKDGVGIEKFSEYVFKVADKFVSDVTNKRVWVTKVEVWEHEKNSAIYSEEMPSVASSLVEDNTTLEISLQAEEIKLEVPPSQPSPQPNPHAARVGNVRTSGWSNPFAGTSWGM